MNCETFFWRQATYVSTSPNTTATISTTKGG